MRAIRPPHTQCARQAPAPQRSPSAEARQPRLVPLLGDLVIAAGNHLPHGCPPRGSGGHTQARRGCLPRGCPPHPDTASQASSKGWRHRSPTGLRAGPRCDVTGYTKLGTPCPSLPGRPLLRPLHYHRRGDVGARQDPHLPRDRLLIHPRLVGDPSAGCAFAVGLLWPNPYPATSGAASIGVRDLAKPGVSRQLRPHCRKSQAAGSAARWTTPTGARRPAAGHRLHRSGCPPSHNHPAQPRTNTFHPRRTILNAHSPAPHTTWRPTTHNRAAPFQHSPRTRPAHTTPPQRRTRRRTHRQRHRSPPARQRHTAHSSGRAAPPELADSSTPTSAHAQAPHASPPTRVPDTTTLTAATARSARHVPRRTHNAPRFTLRTWPSHAARSTHASRFARGHRTPPAQHRPARQAPHASRFARGHRTPPAQHTHARKTRTPRRAAALRSFQAAAASHSPLARAPTAPHIAAARRSSRRRSRAPLAPARSAAAVATARH